MPVRTCGRAPVPYARTTEADAGPSNELLYRPEQDDEEAA